VHHHHHLLHLLHLLLGYLALRQHQPCHLYHRHLLLRVNSSNPLHRRVHILQMCKHFYTKVGRRR
jgi:hypothetical protein